MLLDRFISIDNILSQRSVQNSDEPAIVYAPFRKTNKVISYATLNCIADGIAKFITLLTDKPNKKILIFGNRTENIVYAIFGAFRSNSAYSIVDICHPDERIKTYIDVLMPDVCITCGHKIPETIKQYLQTTYQTHLIEFNEEIKVPCGYSETRDVSSVEADTTAIYTFTSGSTGIPKCVMGKHSSLVRFYPEVGELLNLDHRHRYGMLSGISHDPLQRDIFTPVFFGATVYIPEQNILLNSEKITEWIETNEINIVCVTPSMMQILISGKRLLPSLTHVFSVGERLLKKDAYKMFEIFDGKLINMYGSTESQRAVSMYVMVKSDVNSEILDSLDVIPSGKGVGPVEILIVKDGAKVENGGDIGEIFIRSPYLSNGYYGLEKETSDKFVLNPLTNAPDDIVYKTGDLGRYLHDGNLVCTGRIDNQIKVRGYRIELSEIDICLSKHQHVDMSITLLKRVGEDELILSWVKSNIDKETILAHLRKYLPHYMIPDDIIIVDRFEVNHNNKIDVDRLQEYKIADKQIVVSEVIDFIKSLGHVVTTQSNLIDFGMTSFSVAHLVSYINTTYNKRYKIMDLYRRPTLEQFLELEESQSRQHKVDLRRIIKEKYKSTISPKTVLNVGYNVFLTGCTGFLGSHLMIDYLRIKSCKRIIVHVRASTTQEAVDKIVNSVSTYHNMSYAQLTELCTDRLLIATGDLSKPKLGMNDTDYQSLLNHINIIVHNGAEVDWLKSYDQLEAVNVNSTIEIINLAAKCKTFVKLNFISSTAIFDNVYHNSKQTISNTEVFPDKAVDTIQGGYAETKFVADTLVRLARRKGIICNVFRTGYLICDTKHYKWIERDFLVKMLKYCVSSRTIPLTPINNSLIFNMMPVDLASSVILKCSERECNLDINLVGPDIDLCMFLSTAANIVNVTPVDYSKWVDAIPKESEIYTLKDFLPDVNTHVNKQYDRKVISKYVLNDMINIQNIVTTYLKRAVCQN